MDKQKRSILVRVRVSEAELAELTENVKKSGLKSREAYLRKMIFTGQIVRLDLSEIHETIRLLATATNNINQMAKRANETRNIYETDILCLRQQVQESTTQVRDILKVYQKAKLLFSGSV